MNNTFSIQRLARYAKSDLTANKRLHILSFLGIIGFFMTIYYLNYLNMPSPVITHGETESLRYEYYLTMPRQLSIFLIIFLILINASISFRNYLNKGLASAIMMLPISKIEKFAYVYILNIVIIPLVLSTVFLIIDYGWQLGFDLGSEWWIPINKYTLELTLNLTAIMSVYFWGAIRFRRYQFLIVTLLLICISAIWFIIMSSISIDWENIIFSTLFGKHEYFISIGVYISLIILFSVLAWQRFSRFQIIK